MRPPTPEIFEIKKRRNRPVLPAPSAMTRQPTLHVVLFLAQGGGLAEVDSIAVGASDMPDLTAAMR